MTRPRFYHHPAIHLPSADISAIATYDHDDVTPLYLSLPHGGRSYPCELIKEGAPSIDAFRSLEDIGTDLLAPLFFEQGCSVISAPLSRAIIDVNRPAHAFDEALYDEDIPSHQDQDDYRAYIASGYGVMPRLSAMRAPLYQKAPPFALAQQLRDKFHTPYHQKLKSALTYRQTYFGEALLVDVHSMPGRANGKSMPDIIFGDCHGRSLPPALRRFIDGFMAPTGLSHSWNYPYAGGYITKNYGHMQGPIYALQIEINRHLYLARPQAAFDLRLDQPKLMQIGHIIAKLATTLTASLQGLSAAQ